MNDIPDTKCGANKTTGEGPCNNGAGKGTDHLGFGHCYKHSGSTPNGGKHAAKEEAAWRARVDRLVEPALDTMEGLLDAKGEGVQLGAAKDLLDRAGVKVTDDDTDTHVTVIFNMDDLP